MTTSREIVKRTILFQNPERIPYELPEKWGFDFAYMSMTPSPDARPLTSSNIYNRAQNENSPVFGGLPPGTTGKT